MSLFWFGQGVSWDGPHPSTAVTVCWQAENLYLCMFRLHAPPPSEAQATVLMLQA